MGLKDVIAELDRIRSAGLVTDYAVGGAVAAGVYIEVGSTLDIDVFVLLGGAHGSPLAPLGPVWADLVAHGAKEEDGYLVIGDWPVQLLMGKPLVDEAVSRARVTHVEGMDTRIMSPEYLAAIALDTGRLKDHLRVEEFIRRARIDMPVFLELVDRFELADRWQAFQRKFLETDG